jgi:DNA-binding beta-propeller fold protein YncE
MVRNSKSISRIVLRLLVVLALLGCPQIGSAAGTWSVLSLPRQPADVVSPVAVAADAVGDLYIADQSNGAGIQMRDARGSWSVIAAPGDGPGQVNGPAALAVDTTGSLYVADQSNGGRVQKRDAQGNWSILAARGQVDSPNALVVDAAGNLYVAEAHCDFCGSVDRIQKRDAQGSWSVLATEGESLGQVHGPRALALDTADNLYVADGRIQQRDAQGNWSVIATEGPAPGQGFRPTALAADTAGNLYVADSDRIERWDAEGNWSVLATHGSAGGQVLVPSALAVDTAGNLYATDYGAGNDTSRIQKRDAQGSWSVLATESEALVGQVYFPSALAVDAAGNLYVADYGSGYDPPRIQKRDAQGNWSVLASFSRGLGGGSGTVYGPAALAVDAAGNLYVAEFRYYNLPNETYRWIHKRDAQGNWSVLASTDSGPGQVYAPAALAVDAARNLYVADARGGYGDDRIQKRDPQGHWSVVAVAGNALGQVDLPFSLAVDAAGNLYVAEQGVNRIQKRDGQGNWSVLATHGDALGQVTYPSGLAVDTAGNLYVADSGSRNANRYGRIQKCDAQGNWSVIAPAGGALGQVLGPAGLAVDTGGSLYVADSFRVQEYTLLPGP